MKKLYIFSLLLIPFALFAQPKPGYYDTTVDKTEAALKTALYLVVSSHTERTYAQLWTDFQSTDKRADGFVWDMYSNCSYTFVKDQDSGSGGSAECQFYNREHSFPKSWFNDGTPMYTDLFHLYPTDKYVNNQRNNYPYGETSSQTSITYLNGSKLGISTFSGYTGTVFEPIDEYKGDFARTYFYMVTAYEDKISSWNSEHLDKDIKKNKTYPGLNNWSINLLLKWHRQDPVSTKETNRNNAVEKVQKNRNPFIDYPMLAEHIWGIKKGEPWSFTSGINEISIEFTVSPNPVKDILNIKSDEPNLKLTIFNLNGQILKQEELNGHTSISTAQLNNGMYLIQLSTDTRKTIQKFIVNQ